MDTYIHTMPTMSQAKGTAALASNEAVEEDVGALIYREVQLRKAEAAAAAAKSKKTSTASTHRRTSTRKRSSVKNQKEGPLINSRERKGTSKKRKRVASNSNNENDRPRNKVTRKMLC